MFTGCCEFLTPFARSEPPKKLTLTYRQDSPKAKPLVGTDVEATAEGLTPHQKVDLRWGTVNGGWVGVDVGVDAVGVSIVPEPSSSLLACSVLTVGGALFGLARARRRSRTAA